MKNKLSLLCLGLLIAFSNVSCKPVEESEVKIEDGLVDTFVDFPQNLDSQTNSSGNGAEQLGNHFEGDLLMSSIQMRQLLSKTGLKNTRYRWVNGIIPYDLSPNYGANDRNIIISAMNEIQSYTCLKFVQRTNQYDYIFIYSGSGCSSYVGRQGSGRQDVSLMRSTNGMTCMIKGIAMHELIHAAGFYHMHSHTERDNYIRINYENIPNNLAYAFNKYGSDTVDGFGTSFDYESIMLYDRKAFSTNGRDTITTKDPKYASKIGQRTRLSNGDITRLKNMYNCK